MKREPLKAGDQCLIVGGWHGLRCSCATGRAIVVLKSRLSPSEAAADEPGWWFVDPYPCVQGGVVTGCSERFLMRIDGPEAHGQDEGDVLVSAGRPLEVIQS